MAEMPPINITIDQDALRKQLADILDEATLEFAARLRHSAHILDPEFAKREQEYWDARVQDAETKGYERGRKDPANG